jgi:hypothetical protein
MCRSVVRSLVMVALVVVGRSDAAGEPRTPEATLQQYLQALQAGKAEDAYEYVSKAMRAGKSREVWAKEQREVGSFAEVKIFGFEVGTAKVEGDVAKVPNVLRSQDKLINQMGLTEYELYTLVREDGQWRIDQQVLVEPPDMPKWFPKLAKPPAPTS